MISRSEHNLFFLKPNLQSPPIDSTDRLQQNPHPLYPPTFHNCPRQSSSSIFPPTILRNLPPPYPRQSSFTGNCEANNTTNKPTRAADLLHKEQFAKINNYRVDQSIMKFKALYTSISSLIRCNYV